MKNSIMGLALSTIIASSFGLAAFASNATAPAAKPASITTKTSVTKKMNKPGVRKLHKCHRVSKKCIK